MKIIKLIFIYRNPPLPIRPCTGLTTTIFPTGPGFTPCEIVIKYMLKYTHNFENLLNRGSILQLLVHTIA